MKRLTLKTAWKKCLTQWAYVIRARRYDKRRSRKPRHVGFLKTKWLRTHGYETKDFLFHCFFCEYDRQHKDGCLSCPAVKVDPQFSCSCPDYSYANKPEAFYKKLCELNPYKEEE